VVRYAANVGEFMSDPYRDNGVAAAGFHKSWISISILLLIVALGAFLRLHNLAKQNLWNDEYWTLYLATGRGDALFHAPLNQILEHPPDVGFSGAPAWWHIWNGIDSTSHPPLYHIFLRFWVDLLGDSDGSIRGMSALISLGCVVLLYVAVREFSGDNRQALIAAGLMAMAPIQVYYSQQVRPYTMIQLIALMGAIVLISIEKRGWTWLKLLALGLVVIAMALTHYFCAGVIAAFAAYSIIRFRGSKRLAVFATIVVAGAVAAVAWGSHVGDYSVANYGRITGRSLLHLVLSVPQRLTLESNHDPLAMADNGSWTLVIAIAAIAYLLPLLMLRRRPYLLLWWLWIGCEVGLVLVIDLRRHSTLLTISRYVVPAAPGLYAILAAPLPGRIGKLVPWVILAGVLVFSVDYWQVGPPTSQDLVSISNRVAREALPNDVVIVTGNYYFAGGHGPPLTYYVIAHYAGPWKEPVVFGTSLFSREVQLQLKRFRRIWVVGISSESDTRCILPGWQVHDVQGSVAGNSLWYVTPPKAGNL
jgi:hypothetical protein